MAVEMANNQWIWHVDEQIPTDVEQGRRIITDLLDQLGKQGWAESDVFAVQLAVEEALVNAIKHGNQFDEQKQVHIACGLSESRLWIQITDEGGGFDPADVPDPTDPANLENPSGRGIMLMRSFMSLVEYNESGNRVSMEKCREP